MNSPDWRRQAACRGMDPELFFPDIGHAAKEAKAVCATCPVRDPCYEAGRHEHFGVWGGTTRKERQLAEKGHTSGRPVYGCRICGMPREHRHRYCSDDCRAIARKTTQQRYNQRQQWEAS